MIKYILKCHKDHEFESWFSDSKEFDNLKKKELLECIFCLSKKIDKSIMSPMLSGTKENNQIKGAYEHLIKNITAKKITDIEQNKDHLIPFIQNKILERYVYEKGVYQHKLKNDVGISKAFTLINDTKAYNKLLSN